MDERAGQTRLYRLRVGVVHHFLGPRTGHGRLTEVWQTVALTWALAVVRWLTAVMGPVRNLDSRTQ